MSSPSESGAPKRKGMAINGSQPSGFLRFTAKIRLGVLLEGTAG